MKEIKRKLKKVPYFIQGSFVLDELFNKKFHRDIDIFCEQGKKDEIPIIEQGKFHHIIEIDGADFLLGCYNLDRYFMLPGGEIISPKNYSKKPKILRLLPQKERILTCTDVIRGIKHCLRYNLRPTREVENGWREGVERMFSRKINLPVYQESEEDIRKNIKKILEGETNEDEREEVFQVLRKYCSRL